MKKNTIIEVNDLFFAYQNMPVLEQASFSIQKGEFVGLFGPNGGGKTTLLKLLMGLLTPQRGHIRVFGSLPKMMRTRMAYVPQHVQLDRSFPISVLEVVLLGCLSQLSFWGTFSSDLKERGKEALGKVDLRHKATAAFGTLSGGEAQRVLIARAIVNQPELLLLDEPTSNVDPRAERMIYELLMELNKTMTILMVSHDLQTILDKVQRFICVQRRVSILETKQVCEHFALGLYHTPLTSQDHFSF